jgi:hypothetical protein
MFDPNTMFAALAVAVAMLASATIVLSKVIPDEYDRRAPVKRRVDQRRR